MLALGMGFLPCVVSLPSAHGPAGVQSSHCPQVNIHSQLLVDLGRPCHLSEEDEGTLGKRPKAEGNTNCPSGLDPS